MHTDEPENLTIAETIAKFRIGRTKLFNLIAEGDIEAIKLGSRTLVRTASVREFIDQLPRVAGK
jgi:hypothetical protein